MATFEETIRDGLGIASIRELIQVILAALLKKLNWGYATIQAELDEKQSNDTSSTTIKSEVVVGVNNFQYNTDNQCLIEMEQLNRSKVMTRTNLCSPLLQEKKIKKYNEALNNCLWWRRKQQQPIQQNWLPLSTGGCYQEIQSKGCKTKIQ